MITFKSTELNIALSPNLILIDGGEFIVNPSNKFSIGLTSETYTLVKTNPDNSIEEITVTSSELLNECDITIVSSGDLSDYSWKYKSDNSPLNYQLKVTGFNSSSADGIYITSLSSNVTRSLEEGGAAPGEPGELSPIYSKIIEGNLPIKITIVFKYKGEVISGDFVFPSTGYNKDIKLNVGPVKMEASDFPADNISVVTEGNPKDILKSYESSGAVELAGNGENKNKSKTLEMIL